ncbi:MAG: hypothetical protein ACT4OX_07555 [Actinomycetota bacterium]
MSDIDPHLRDALRHLADDAPEGDALWGATEQRIVRHRRRRAAASAAASAVTAVAVIAGVVALASDRPNVAVVPPSTTTVPVTQAPGPPAPLASGDRVVARPDGTIEVVDARWRSSERLDRIATLPDRFIRQLAIASDGERVYYLVDQERDGGPYGSDCADLFVIEVDELPRRLTQTRSFALSPDGDRLALGMHSDDGGVCVAPNAGGTPGVRIVDTETLELEREWIDSSRQTQIESLAWHADGQQLAAKRCFGDVCQAFVLVLDRVAGLAAGAPFVPAAPADQVVAIVWGNGPLRTLERCCEEASDAVERDATVLRLRVLDPATGTPVQELMVFEPWAGEVQLVDLDGILHGLRVEGTPAGVEARLYRLDGAGPVRVADGFTAVAARGP